MKYLPILLFIAALNIAIKKCSSPEVKVKKNNKSDNYKKYIELSYLGNREIKKKIIKKHWNIMNKLEIMIVIWQT